MSKLGWVATVHLYVSADSEAQACDVVSELLSGAEYDSIITDWAYVKIFGQLLSPTPCGEIDPNTYEEGDFLALVE